ncbi:MAG: hypothetical protein ABI416_14755 [Ginsengibacter sp.]
MEHMRDIDDLIKNIVHEEDLEAPSSGFTNSVMDTLMATNRKAKAYKPLIPKYILAGITALLLLIILLPIMSGYQVPATKIPWLDKITNGFTMPHLSITIPGEISYILTSALILVLIQVFVIGTLYKRMHR